MTAATYDPLTDETNVVIAAMLTEDTGSSILDSGSAYGRNHERQAGKTVADFRAEPEVEVKFWGPYRDETQPDVDLSISVYHFLSERLDYDAERDAEYQAWASARFEAEPYSHSDLELAQEWAKSHSHRQPWTTNTYNHDSLLSQVIQWVAWDEDDGESYVLLQIHGGCDVRGGYTTPRVFRIPGGDAAYLCDDAELEISCEGVPQAEGQMNLDGSPARTAHHGYETDDAGYHWRDYESQTEVTITCAKRDDGSWYIACPACGAPMTPQIKPGP
jgi:hypothetical protein